MRKTSCGFIYPEGDVNKQKKKKMCSDDVVCNFILGVGDAVYMYRVAHTHRQNKEATSRFALHRHPYSSRRLGVDRASDTETASQLGARLLG